MVNDDFTLQPSKIFLGILVIMHAGAIPCCVFIQLPWWLKIFFLGIIVTSFLYYTIKFFYSKHRITGVGQNSSGEWYVRTNTSDAIFVNLAAHSIITKNFVLLNCYTKLAKKFRQVVIFNDSLPEVEFRRLRFLLFTPNLK